MKALIYDELVKQLTDRFPGIEIKDAHEYSADIPPMHGLWIVNCRELTYTEKDQHVLYEAYGPHKHYEMDIYRKFHQYCKARGWYATSENYTINIYR